MAHDFLPIYFGSLGFCYILVFSCMLFLQWRKGIQRDRRARAWVQRKKMEWSMYRTLALYPDKETQPGTKEVLGSSIPQPQGSFLSNDIATGSSSASFLSLPNADPYKPVFQEIACASALSHLPPLLDHSASYPCSSIPAKSTPFKSPLKFAILKNESYHDGSSISA
ncbi:hypothetical protein lerEdw1_018695 [Lerista edwardsae]|nr:hypothetical protein lerEdw1_018695 [Lerista edwardsae]